VGPTPQNSSDSSVAGAIPVQLPLPPCGGRYARQACWQDSFRVACRPHGLTPQFTARDVRGAVRHTFVVSKRNSILGEMP